MNKEKKYRLIFYSTFLLLSLLQAGFTELMHDEAYYWFLSQKLAWGYFDHPPLLPWLIRAGAFLGQTEIAVRCLIVLLGVGTIYVLEKIVQPKNPILFYKLVSGVAAIHLVTQFALPDTPLIFFSACFYYGLKKWLKAAHFKNSVFLALAITGMCLSKYHAVLPIVFSVLAVPKVLKQPTFYLIVFLVCLGLCPAVLWQMHHHYPTLSYHFYERSPQGASWQGVFDFIAPQPLIFGPLFGVVLFNSLRWRHKNNPFLNLLKVNAIGVFAFFILMLFFNRVEAHWTLIALIPMLILGYHFIENNSKWEKFIHKTWWLSLGLILVVRLILVVNILPDSWHIDQETMGNRAQAKAIEKIAGAHPVLFMNSYQAAAKYSFYTGNRASNFSNYRGRRSQYSLLKLESQWQDSTVFIVPNTDLPNSQIIDTKRGKVTLSFVEKLESYGDVRLKILNEKVVVEPGASFPLDFKIENETLQNGTPKLIYAFFKGVEYISETEALPALHLSDTASQKIIVTAPAVPGQYLLRLCLKNDPYPPYLNAFPLKVIVKIKPDSYFGQQ